MTKYLLAALVLLAAGCDVQRPTAPVASTVRAEGRIIPFDGTYSAPLAVGETVRYLSSFSQGGIVALTSEGNVWLRYPDESWFKLQPAPATPFTSVTGTPQGNVYAVDQSGQVWQFVGGWVAVSLPGGVQ